MKGPSTLGKRRQFVDSRVTDSRRSLSAQTQGSRRPHKAKPGKATKLFACTWCTAKTTLYFYRESILVIVGSCVKLSGLRASRGLKRQTRRRCQVTGRGMPGASFFARTFACLQPVIQSHHNNPTAKKHVVMTASPRDCPLLTLEGMSPRPTYTTGPGRSRRNTPLEKIDND